MNHNIYPYLNVKNYGKNAKKIYSNYLVDKCLQITLPYDEKMLFPFEP